MAPPRKVTAAQEEQIRGMASRGEPYRAIGEALGISAGTVSRIVTPPPERVPAIVGNTKRTLPQRLTPQDPPAAPPTRPTEPKPPVVIPDDVREIERSDWVFYETLKVRLREYAADEAARNNVRGYRDLLREARAAEERAAELRPPKPPDPENDPTYRRPAQLLADYITALVERREQREPLPERTLPPTVAIASA